MFKIFIDWYRRQFSDPHAVALVAVLLLTFLTIYFFHSILTPVLFSIVLSYLLEKPIHFLINRGIARTISVVIIMLIFIAILLVALIIFVPLIWQQGISLIITLPDMITKLNEQLLVITTNYPELVDMQIFDSLINSAKLKASQAGESIFQFSLSSLISMLSLSINLILIPLIMFFMLKDKTAILEFTRRYLPRNRSVMNQVVNEMNQQISNYINGKAIEIFILTVATYIPFWYFKLNYGLLLSVIVGFSVIIPYIGIIIVSIPVTLVAIFQFGMSPDFVYLLVSYAVVQLLDGSVLVPLLFSEALNLHPLIIILAVIVFGGLWGFWGAFFAIPLATLLKAIVYAWPTKDGIVNT